MQNKSILFICNTYMQLITAVQILQKIETDINADIMISDHSVNAKRVADKLSICGLFRHTRLIETKYMSFGQNTLRDLLEVFCLALGNCKKYVSLFWPDVFYDKIYYFNMSQVVQTAYRLSICGGKKVKCVCFEEGILSYRVMLDGCYGRRLKLMFQAHKLLKKKNFRDETTEYCCFYPELMPEKALPCRRIPTLTRDDRVLIESFNQIFSYNPAMECYPQKYIFFGSSLDIDGNNVGESELVLQIANFVGKENLLVKMHPRDGRDVYGKHGITVSCNSTVPWEVIQLNHDFSNHVFLTVSSTSVLNASAMLGDRVMTYFLFPVIKDKNPTVALEGEKIEKAVAALQSKGELQQIRFVRDM